MYVINLYIRYIAHVPTLYYYNKYNIMYGKQSVRYSHIEIICSVINLHNAHPVHDILGISVHLLQYTHTKLCF